MAGPQALEAIEMIDQAVSSLPECASAQPATTTVGPGTPVGTRVHGPDQGDGFAHVVWAPPMSHDRVLLGYGSGHLCFSSQALQKHAIRRSVHLVAGIGKLAETREPQTFASPPRLDGA